MDKETINNKNRITLDYPEDTLDEDYIDNDPQTDGNTEMDSNSENEGRLLELMTESDASGMRIDKYLSEKLEGISRSLICEYIDAGHIKVDDKKTKPGRKLSGGENISVMIPPPKVLDVKPENIKLDIVYEDSDILIVNKPKGMVVHPAPGHYEGTLVNALMYYLGDDLSGINGVLRPGIVHRIDRDTTGLLVICKNDKAHNHIADLLKTHDITRTYHAIVRGNIDDDGTIRSLIGRDPKNRKKMLASVKTGREAVTHYHVIERFRGYTYISCELETGRTHQIRVHMASIGHPVLGDEVYGGIDPAVKVKMQGQCLHAKTLGFIHPTTGEYVEFDSELPDYFQKVLTYLRK